MFLVIGELKLQVHSKRQTPDSSWAFLKIEIDGWKQLKTILMDKNYVKLLIYVLK